eukprot:TRINITY_DN4385_c0_g2_i5.p1 TRINITY_DN4385_c0_g2~~TRINITY_DN4385_c0_g2_i5.p1  ORF type:complete len:112 (+),score=7.20 TRINITY_DN4385_c0_g2_i5:2697-3032(+)
MPIIHALEAENNKDMHKLTYIKSWNSCNNQAGQCYIEVSTFNVLSTPSTTIAVSDTRIVSRSNIPQLGFPSETENPRNSSNLKWVTAFSIGFNWIRWLFCRFLLAEEEGIE